jgi:hypothetical protein
MGKQEIMDIHFLDTADNKIAVINSSEIVVESV